ncbi:ComF family protein [Derxia lacustris]|uniref:ComF family protein n=1 Tax=Derxia lacustris TaxID=764842 RepID=UPI00111C0DF9|nr:double zinc ribbon domain-containing protein [Derxia lacustris]
MSPRLPTAALPAPADAAARRPEKRHSPGGFARELAAALFGNRCVACGAAAGARGLCAACLRSARRIERQRPRCLRCAEALDATAFHALPLDGAGPLPICAHCAAAPPPWSQAVVGAAYEPPWDRIELALKFGAALPNAPALASLIELALRARHADLAGWWLLPVPLAPARLATRGYNQADRIARALAAGTGARVDNGALLRRLDTPAIARLGRAARTRALTGAFALAPGAQQRLAGQRIALIDDVMTTGATLRAAALSLAPLRPGALCVLAALRTPPPDS